MQPDSQTPPQEDAKPAPQEELGSADVNAQQENEVLLEWSIEDNKPDHHNTTWYIILGVIGFAIILAAILTQVWVLIPLGILVPWAITIYANRGIGDHTYQLETYSFSIDGKSHAYQDYKSFFIVENANVATFELIPNQRFGQLATIHAGSDDAEDVVEILASVLPESEPQGYVGESFFRRLKF